VIYKLLGMIYEHKRKIAGWTMISLAVYVPLWIGTSFLYATIIVGMAVFWGVALWLLIE